MPYFALIIMFYHVKIACYQACCLIWMPSARGELWENGRMRGTAKEREKLRLPKVLDFSNSVSPNLKI